MKKVCVLLADGFEEIEGLTVVDLLSRNLRGKYIQSSDPEVGRKRSIISKDQKRRF